MISFWISHADTCLILLSEFQVQSKESSGMLHYLSGGAWDPHDGNSVAVTCESSVQFWDLRTMKYVPYT